MGKETLVIPEEDLEEVIKVIIRGLFNMDVGEISRRICSKLNIKSSRFHGQT
jgi:hypothetical protein